MGFSEKFTKYNDVPIFLSTGKFSTRFKNEIIKTNDGIFPSVAATLAPKTFKRLYMRQVRNLILKDDGVKPKFLSRKANVRNGIVISKLKNDFIVKDNRIVPAPPKRQILIDDDGDIAHVNKALPLMIEEFAEEKLSNQKIIKIKKGLKVNGIRLIDEIDEKEEVLLKLKISFEFGYVADRRSGSISPNIKITPSELDEDLYKQLILESKKYEFLNREKWNVEIKSVEIVSQFNNSDEFEKVNLRLRESENLEIPNVNLDVKFKNTGNGNCVREFLVKKWKKMSKKVIKNLGNDDGVSTKEILELCKYRKIQCYAYDINGRILAKYTPKKRNKSFASIYFIAYNNHIYPLTGKLKKQKVEYDTYEIIEDSHKKLNELLNAGYLPLEVKATCNNPDKLGVRVVSFIHNRIKYIENDEYEKCLEILTKFNLQSKIHDFVRIFHLGTIIETAYNEEYNVNSFWPNNIEFVKGGYTNFYENDFDDSEITTIDKNKCYSYALMKLPFLIKTDYRQSTIRKIDEPMSANLDIVDHYLYVVSPKYSSVLMPDVNCYAGYELKFYYEQGLEFDVLEEMTAEKVDNYFSQMVKDVYEKEPENAKHIINIMIGKMEIDNPIQERFKIDNIYNKEEIKLTNGYAIPINDNYFFNATHTQKFNLYTRKPISIQVKDYARRILYNKMVDMKLKPEQVIQIKTDSISFLGSIEQLDKPPTKLLYGWKLEEFKKINKVYRSKGDASFYQPEFYKNNHLFNCYAGAGKTYSILNNLIPKFESYRVLTPSHSTLKEYKKKNMVACVSQTYEYAHQLPEEQNIIFDEGFLLDRKGNDLLYKLVLLGKNVYLYGDDKQLLPVNEPKHFNSEHYMKYIYGTNIHKMETNFRNNFTKEYYDSIINNEIDIYKEVRNNNVEWCDAEKIICYRNKTIDKYNNMYLKKIGQDDMFYPGAYLRCTTNKLFKFGVYNNFYLTITNVNDDEITFDNGLKLTKTQVEAFFKLGYAITLYGAQGKSFKSFHYPEEDMKFINPRSAYTLISRISNRQ